MTFLFRPLQHLYMRLFFSKWCGYMFQLSIFIYLECNAKLHFHIYCYLLIQAETLRDSFPASDKSLSRLLGEAPYLPKSIFEMLECLCSPGGNDNEEKELHGGDRVTQGLSTVWSLILLRPPIRDACLKIALKVAIHILNFMAEIYY